MYCLLLRELLRFEAKLSDSGKLNFDLPANVLKAWGPRRTARWHTVDKMAAMRTVFVHGRADFKRKWKCRFRIFVSDVRVGEWRYSLSDQWPPRPKVLQVKRVYPSLQHETKAPKMVVRTCQLWQRLHSFPRSPHTLFAVALVVDSPVERARKEAAGVVQHVTRIDHFPENLKEMRRVLSSFVERREYIQRDRRVCAFFTHAHVHTFNAKEYTNIGSTGRIYWQSACLGHRCWTLPRGCLWNEHSTSIECPCVELF